MALDDTDKSVPEKAAEAGDKAKEAWEKTKKDTKRQQKKSGLL